MTCGTVACSEVTQTSLKTIKSSTNNITSSEEETVLYGENCIVLQGTKCFCGEK